MKNIILIGFMGAGKTTIGQALAQQCGLIFEDTDQLIETKAGKTISAIFAEQGEEVFREMETALLEDLLSREDGAASVYSVGGGLPMREENRMLLKKLGTVIYLTIQPDTVLERLKGDTTRPLLAGDNVRERVEGLLTQRDPFYRAAAHHQVSVDNKGISELVEEILACFEENRPELGIS